MSHAEPRLNKGAHQAYELLCLPAIAPAPIGPTILGRGQTIMQCSVLCAPRASIQTFAGSDLPRSSQQPLRYVTKEILAASKVGELVPTDENTFNQ